MTKMKNLLLLSSVATAWQFPSLSQAPLGGASPASDFQCDLPSAIDPSGDGLPSAEDLFSSEEALRKQVERHQAVVRVPSISYDDNGEPNDDPRWAPFWDLHDTLGSLFPNVHRKASLEKINTLGLVYTIHGTDPSLKPTLLAAHQDVVPVADASTWKHPPFAAVYDGEYLWGRGASDDKNSLTALLSAVEALIINDWTPRRTLILAFGFDEECSGKRGAATIAEYLTEKYGDGGIGVILDEGGAGLLELDDTLYALPAVMEKGHVDIWIELSVVGGHSSVPFPHTAIGIMAEMISALESHPYAPTVIRDSPVHKRLQCQARYSPDLVPEIASYLHDDDLEGLAKWLSTQTREWQYMIQTSQAVDMISGGQKINAMPEFVSLGVNYRVAPQDNIPRIQHNLALFVNATVHKYGLDLKAYEGDQDYKEYLSGNGEEMFKPVYNVDYNGTLTLTAKQKTKVAPVTPTEGTVWDTFSGVVRHTFAKEGRTVVPVGQIMTGNTDTRHYLDLSPHIYRFVPNSKSGSINIHTIDERIHMGEHMDVLKFYYNFIRGFDQADL